MENFTKKQVDQLLKEARQKWETEDLQPLKAEIEQLKQSKPEQQKIEDDKDLEIKELKAQLLHQKVINTLTKEQLEDFAEFINISDEKELAVKVEKLKKILNDRKLNNSFRPSDHRPTDEYHQAEKTGDVQGMIYAKIQRIFD
jgi:carbonic anhydrase